MPEAPIPSLVQLEVLRTETIDAATPEPKTPPVVRRVRAWVVANRFFLAFVLLPLSLVWIYLFHISADLYVSEARYVVRSPASVHQFSDVGTLSAVASVQNMA